MTQGSGVLVVAEQRDGNLTPATLELITAARSLSDSLGGNVTVGVVGAGIDRVAQAAAGVAGVDEVVTVTDDRMDAYNGPAWSAAVARIVEEVGPAIVMAPATTAGRDYLPRVAARLKTGHASDAVGVEIADGKVVATRLMFEDRVQTAVAFEGGGPAVIAVRPGSFARSEESGGSATVRALDFTLDDAAFTLTAEAPEAEAAGQRALAGAERIVAGGRGLGEAEKFSLVEELAGQLDAAVAATRPLSDAGWRPHSDQIGQTGAQVSPKLYVAVGISGAAQHLMGVQNADYIVAINRDPEAPIFKVASFGIVGDLFEVVPAVIEELKAAQS
ncbi:MAG TPA: electron transfer flavoprotein subunit alpha/FixB family protein [Thermomicrobiales bacterium]|nr:electron transfer flavoprotein subunit alpha/FixB family protein [Thermomicrobiales bacterium]